MRRLAPTALVILALLASGPRLARAAEPVFLQLKIQGADVKGDVTLKGVEGTIECLAYEQEVTVPGGSTGVATGRRQYQPLRITKRIDQASPLLLKALSQNMVVEGTFRFYRVAKTGAGVQQFYTVEIKQARVASVKQGNPDRLNPAAANLPATEEVTFHFSSIRWTFVDGGVTFEDTAGGVSR